VCIDFFLNIFTENKNIPYPLRPHPAPTSNPTGKKSAVLLAVWKYPLVNSALKDVVARSVQGNIKTSELEE
jgi:hypothetical protein